MKKIDDKDFELANLPIEAQDPEITKEDFVLQDSDNAVHEQKFQTKPTTFFKDSMKRFAKNKSSVVAAFILGILILLAIIVPFASPYDVSKPQDVALSNLEPKLFNNAGGFWDGTKSLDRISSYYDSDLEHWVPDQEAYPVTGIVGGVDGINVGDEEYTNIADKNGFEGYALVGYYGSTGVNTVSLKSSNPAEYIGDIKDKQFALELDEIELTLTNFEVVDLAKIRELEEDDKIELPQGYSLGLTSLEFNYFDMDEKKYVPVTIVEPALTHNINPSNTVNVKEKILSLTGGEHFFTQFYFTITVTPVSGTPADANVCGLVRNMVIHDSRADDVFVPTAEEPINPHLPEIEYFSIDLGRDLNGICFNNAMSFVARNLEIGYGVSTQTNRGYWNIGSSRNYSKEVYLGKCRFVSFVFNSYEATLGETWEDSISLSILRDYKTAGWVTLRYSFDYDEKDKPYLEYFELHITDKENCPLLDDLDMDDVVSVRAVKGKESFDVRARVIKYKFLGFKEMPKFIFGTDKAGRDMFKYVFEGLRNSLGLGIITFAVCFLFGLIWGAVSGYFGGNVDLAMERLTDILSGMPWIVVMTIIVMHMGRNFVAFALALCLTGWIGTASTTRTQFYRFRGREYVLASRTLGASDARLIAKHILPNAMGTIITGAVLMIPSVIFSEATLAYLGLGFQDRSSLGVILSANQGQLFNHPYQLIFPAVIISLLMISFNLFGNGLRDAINPSLKGEGE